jgi:hypothetical protein
MEDAVLSSLLCYSSEDEHPKHLATSSLERLSHVPGANTLRLLRLLISQRTTIFTPYRRLLPASSYAFAAVQCCLVYSHGRDASVHSVIGTPLQMPYVCCRRFPSSLRPVFLPISFSGRLYLSVIPCLLGLCR